MSGSCLFNYESYYNGLMTDLALCASCVRDVSVCPNVMLALELIFFVSLIVFLRFLGCFCFAYGLELSMPMFYNESCVAR